MSYISDLIIDDLTSSGQGIGTYDGLKIFIDGPLPGETVSCKILERKKRYAKAKLLKIIKSSEQRKRPVCPLFGSCGGCQLMHLSYEGQLEWKRKRVFDALARIGKLDVDVASCRPSPRQLGYRNKIHLHQGGFHKRHSHTIIPINKCYIHNPIGDAKIENAREVVIKSSFATDEVMVIKNGKADRPYITEKLGALEFRIRPKDFFQVNPAAALELYKQVIEFARIDPSHRILDAYCGVGGLALFAAGQAYHVHGIECVETAIESARENAELNGINNVTFSCQQIEQVPKIDQYDTIFLNPPRGGVDPRVLAQCQSQRLVYVSCDPATLARDLNSLTDRYMIEKVIPFDLFPQTVHVETVVSLFRR